MNTLADSLANSDLAPNEFVKLVKPVLLAASDYRHAEPATPECGEAYDRLCDELAKFELYLLSMKAMCVYGK